MTKNFISAKRPCAEGFRWYAGTVEVLAHIDAGWGIRADGGIRASGAIRAGESLYAGDEICAGAGYGIYAGLDIRADAWEACATVRAATPAADLRSGWWAGSHLAATAGS